MSQLDVLQQMLEAARAEALTGFREGGVPIGAAVFSPEGKLLGRGRNRRVQDRNLFMHAETAAMIDVGPRAGGFLDVTLVTTLAPCWWCSGLVRQFGIPKVVIGDTVHDMGGTEWLRDAGVEVIDLHDEACIELMRTYESSHPDRAQAGRGLVPTRSSRPHPFPDGPHSTKAPRGRG